MFINLSNHPSCKFTADQMTAAKTFGDIVDVPFPNVAPYATAMEVDAMAAQKVSEIIYQYGTKCTIHVMGELTFCHSFVKYAKARNIRCISSTTERIAIDNPDGSKTSVFKFATFRDYM